MNSSSTNNVPMTIYPKPQKPLSKLIDKLSGKILNIAVLLIVIILGVGVFTGNVRFGSTNVEALIHAQNNQVVELSKLNDSLSRHTEIISRLIVEMQYSKESIRDLKEKIKELEVKIAELKEAINQIKKQNE